MSYIWEQDNWPKVTWDGERLLHLLARVSHEQGLLLGRMDGLGFDLKNEAQLHSLTDEVINSSEIEGETLPHDQVRSSIARRLEMKGIKHLVPSVREVDSVVGMMTNAADKYDELLTPARLFDWQASLFTAESILHPVTTGCYRNSSMQVVSGAIGREKIHYEAPPPNRLESEMREFLDWFESPGDINPLLIAGLAHFWFVTIHPFDDGNGRIARAIADMALARAESSPRRFYSMSKQILIERNDYYKMLEQTQKGSCDITAWQEWFLGCLLRAIQSADKSVGVILQKARFWQRFAEESLNERQIKMLNRLLDGFNGKLKTEKWAKITQCSSDTALRDINDLISRGALRKDQGGGRSTGYSLVLEE
ncbi:MAG: Fic family protein [Pseudomonadales bacterium]